MRFIPLILSLCLIPAGLLLAFYLPVWGALLAMLVGVAAAIGLYDVQQNRSAILKNYPLSARLRFLFEHFRPEIRQYFLEGDHEEPAFPK